MQLYYMRSRWYDPRTHRFISEDPMGIEAGINRYAFAANDPVTNLDPFGTLSNRGPCTLYAATCGSDELEEWSHSMGSPGSGGQSCWVGGDSSRFEGCLQRAADYLGVPVFGFEPGKPLYVTPEHYVKPGTFILDYQGDDGQLHVWKFEGAAFQKVWHGYVDDRGKWGIVASYRLVGYAKADPHLPDEFLLIPPLVQIRSTLVEYRPGEYTGGFVQWGKVHGYIWGRGLSPELIRLNLQAELPTRTWRQPTSFVLQSTISRVEAER